MKEKIFEILSKYGILPDDSEKTNLPSKEQRMVSELNQLFASQPQSSSNHERYMKLKERIIYARVSPILIDEERRMKDAGYSGFCIIVKHREEVIKNYFEVRSGEAKLTILDLFEQCNESIKQYMGI